MMAWICHIRVVSYPQNAWRKSSSVCLVGVVAVKFAGSTGGNGGACGGGADGTVNTPLGGAAGVGAAGVCGAGFWASAHAALLTARTKRRRFVRSCIQFLSNLAY